MLPSFHVFVDTNVWLAFYAFTNDDIGQMNKLIALVETDNLKLYIPQQVVDEFYRNRERKLDASIRDFSKAQVSKAMPRYMLDYPEAADYQTALKNFQSAKDGLVTRTKAEAENKELAADKLFAAILVAAAPLPVDQNVIGKALQRKIRGNPPGKATSTGDQINWESLLEAVPDCVDLHIVSNDGDFESKLIAGRADQFLIDEWAARKHGKLTLHSELRPFLNEIFPGIKLAVDVEKAEAIANLLSSGTFATTHYAVSRLSPVVDELTWAEADKLIDAAINNTQVRWIGGDDDVQSLYRRIIKRFEEQIDANRHAELMSLTGLSPAEPVPFTEDDDVPF